MGTTAQRKGSGAKITITGIGSPDTLYLTNVQGENFTNTLAVHALSDSHHDKTTGMKEALYPRCKTMAKSCRGGKCDLNGLNNEDQFFQQYLGVVYGDDDPQKSTTEAEALLAKYPDLRGIISPTTVGVAAAAQVVESAGKCDQVQVTGLGTPNQMRPFLKSGCVKAFQLWDPSVEGEIAGYLSVQMVENGLKLSEGMTISVPDQGDVVINANNLIYAAPMLDFVPDNIDNFNF